jgi:hypothetical protein
MENSESSLQAMNNFYVASLVTLHKKIALMRAYISVLQLIYFENVMKILTFFALSSKKCASWKEISL